MRKINRNKHDYEHTQIPLTLPDAKIWHKNNKIYDTSWYNSLAPFRILHLQIFEIFHFTHSIAFSCLHRYIYTGDWEYHSIKDLFHIFAVANKYELIDLENAAERIIAENVNIENACQIHDFGITYDKEYMKANSMKYIQQYTSVVLRSPFFLTSLYETVLAILDQDHLNVEEEVELFRGLQQYVFRNEMTRDFYKEHKNGVTTTKGKDILAKAVSKIRYLSMPMQDFVDSPLVSDLLTPDEKIAITHLMASKAPKLKLPQGFSDSKVDRGYIR